MIVIPDIHGRDFWKEAVNGLEDEEIIFLGDYTDPYEHEGIEYKKMIQNFQEILDFKMQHMESVHLLLGNHDMHYLYPKFACWRFDVEHYKELGSIYLKNRSLFQLFFEKQIGTRTFLFSHAGLRVGWLNFNKKILRGVKVGKGLANKLNSLCNKPDFIEALENITAVRGGNHRYGSPIWADVDELIDDYLKYKNIPNIFQVVGHTMQLSQEPIICKNFACLDCLCAFYIDDRNGDIYDLKTMEKLNPEDEYGNTSTFDLF